MPTASSITSLVEQIVRGPDLVRQVIYEMPAELRRRRPSAGMWSAHEHAVHLPAVQPIFVARLEHMLSDPSPRIKSFEPSRDDQEGALLALDLDAEMDRYERERAEIVARLRNLTPDEWQITAEHVEYSQYSVFIMFRHLALHDLHHAYKIEERLLRKSWD